MKVEHIGIAVKDLEASNQLFSKLFNQAPFHTEIIESQKLTASFFKLQDTKVELLYPNSEESTIHKFLSKKGEGIHHIAFDVEDIIQEVASSRTTERGTRADDKRSEAAMEDRKKAGYF